MLETKNLRIRSLTEQLNKYRHEYYNLNAPTVPDAVYDRLFDELAQLETETGIVMGNSPTNSVGYTVVSGLETTKHDIPLLSLDKTKEIEDIIKFIGNQAVLLMLKLDGLTVKLEYEDGELICASTRGDGNEGEIITHNVTAICGIPTRIPYKQRLVVTGEVYIPKSVFEELKNILVDSTGKPYKNARNMAAGSIRCYDAGACAKRGLQFVPFNVLEELGEFPDANSKSSKLKKLLTFGFDMILYFYKNKIQTNSENALIALRYYSHQIEEDINTLQIAAKNLDIPIDGIVITYDDIAFSKSCGRTNHHYKDGIAFKFADDLFETVLRSIEWTPSRSGEISPVAIFDSVEIDGCDVSRASLHNLTFIKKLELYIGCRIVISKRNMIIPHVEENLDRGQGHGVFPSVCPCCGSVTRIQISQKDKDNIVETLHCDNFNCATRRLRQFVHFVSKKAMDIEGLSEATLEKFIGKGWLHDFLDIYRLDEHAWEICNMTEGFGAKSWQRLWNAIQISRSTTFERYLISMDIPMIGNTASKELCRVFNGDILAFESAVDTGYDFTQLKDFGDTLHNNIYEWFRIEENRILWEDLKEMVTIKKTETNEEIKENPFIGKTIVVTGTLKYYSRNSINAKIEALGAKAGSSVSKNTDYLICGEAAGSKLDKAKQYGVPVLTEQEFLNMVGEA